MQDRVLKEKTVQIDDNTVIEYYCASDIGVTRKENQDSFVVVTFRVLEKVYVLAVVADGMGGHINGLNASYTVKKVVLNMLKDSEVKSEEELIMIIDSCIVKANKEIFESYKGKSGTTVVALLLDGDNGYWWNIGDSRVYAINNNQGVLESRELLQLSKDHSLMQNLLDSGKLDSEQAKLFDKKNVLLRALGVSMNVTRDTGTFVGADGYILCSDGFWHLATEKELKNLIYSDEPLLDLDELVSKVIKRGERDNVTAVVLRKAVVK